ncbi:NRDE family protein [Lysinibacter cavernae]|uniref:NRDE family protein n=1 Tax=Lysinibacter cavernae TaxID=1640652 RepID=A0A7X5QZP7_9MICO|nr:hypothetical protein [Lysinibacter cavernae]
MCTVVVSIDPDAEWPVVLLGLRDESPSRPWDPPGAWWPDLGTHVRGIHDQEAGGAWLAVRDDEQRLAVVLNRAEQPAEPAGGFVSRGTIPLAAVTNGLTYEGTFPTRTFNLLNVSGATAEYAWWNGTDAGTVPLPPGVHMITHEGPNNRSVPRVARWLDAFTSAERPTGSIADGITGASWNDWLSVLRDSAALPSNHEDALLRAESVHGHPLASLSVTAAAIGHTTVALSHARLSSPGHLDATLDWRS